MSLVVGFQRVESGVLALVGDTRITWNIESGGRPGKSVHHYPTNTIVKVVPINDRRRCVGYAGDGLSDATPPLLRDLDATARTDDELLERLRGLSDDDQLQFLAGMSGVGPLFRIRNGDVEEIPAGRYTWIGDWQGYEGFRAHETGSTDRWFDKMLKAMMAVADDGAVPSIGGLPVAVHGCGSDGAFEMRSVSTFDLRGGLAFGGGGLTLISPTGGEYHVQSYQSAAGEPIVAYWWPHTSTGIVCRPTIALDPSTITAETETTFLDEVETLVGQRLARGLSRNFSSFSMGRPGGGATSR